MATVREAVDPIGPNVELLRRTLGLVEGLTARQYVHVESRLTQASIGAHVRHVLDHYRLFLVGLPRGEVDYDARERDTEIERSVQAALAEGSRLIAELETLRGASCSDDSRPLRVRQQGDAERGRLDGCESHAVRELLFLQSHAVHHQALIALLARAQGLPVPEAFGLSPSTVSYRASNARPASDAREAQDVPTCAR